MALNYLHDGPSFGRLELLGRRPNPVQQRVHERLWALVATCDTPGGEPFSAVPGRSGTEFLARLQELEHFAEHSVHLQVDSYVDGPEDFELKKVGSCKLSEDSLPVKPYSSLDSSRLKLVGRGNWNLADYLDDEFWMPFQEPRILHHGFPLDFSLGPNFKKEPKEENLQLALLWSANGLLALTHSPPHQGSFSRVFNAFKSSTQDRQIGDRCMANQAERHLPGPSQNLPIGFMIAGIHVPPGFRVCGAITDRKDFYHQAKVSRERPMTNVLPFSYPLSLFEGTPAHHDYVATLRKKKTRESGGDNLGHRPSGLLLPDSSKVYPCFQSLFQGDHLGVEFALSSHACLLEEVGLLPQHRRILGNHPFPRGPVYEGLVIDDYFALAVEPVRSSPQLSPAVECFQKAVSHYDSCGVLGSPEKDIAGSFHFKVAGAEVNSSNPALSRGLVTVAAPVQKRLSLAVLSLRIAALPVLSSALASRLAGNWTSVLLYRRCLTCLLSRVYGFSSGVGTVPSDVFELSRKAADEFVLASALSFLAATDVTQPYHDKVFATDASLGKGALVARPVDRRLSEVLWLGGDKRGAHISLDGPFREALRICGEEAEEAQEYKPGPGRALDFSFDFVEVCGGAAGTSAYLAAWGFSVMPPIELSDSPHFDLRDLKVVEWLCNMLKSKRLRSIMLEPVCTTFSPAAHPCVRSYSMPQGFCRSDPKTLTGNIIAFRCLFLAWYASICDVPCLLEQPRLSKMAWLSVWRMLVGQKGFEEAIAASCQFGSPHRKEFRLLIWKLSRDFLDVRCPGGHQHIPIQGAYTKPSAVYVDELAKHFAKAFSTALDRDARAEADSPVFEGIESPICNDLLVSGKWYEVLTWHWRHSSHINILESHSFLTLLRYLAREGSGCRFCALMDSRVAKGSHAKGRSSANALMPSLQKAAAIQVACGLYPSLGFAPTKLNVADDPTRDVPLRETDGLCISELLPLDCVADLHSFGLSKFAARWVRLVVLVGLSTGADAAAALSSDDSSEDFWTLDFSSVASAAQSLFGLCQSCAFAFGLCLLCFVLCSPVSSPQGGRFGSSWTFLFIAQLILAFGERNGFHGMQPLPLALFLTPCHGMPLAPQTAEELGRAERRASVNLAADRVLRPQTRSRREALLTDFDVWLLQNSYQSIEFLLEARDIDAENIAELLVCYGRALYYAGKPYGRYSETINAVAARRPAIRKSLAAAWDLAFSWVTDEPGSHHPAMPLAVVLAFSSLALLWGWPRESALFLLAWCGILRVGEILNGLRSDLVLPVDSTAGIDYALFQIRQPKTRGSAAKHQSARVDPVDVIRLLTAVFGKMPGNQKLWPSSGSTLRKRFGQLQHSLGLPLRKSGAFRPFDLASLRPGGATHLLQRFEDGELVRRRGRWLSSRVMEIYLQEVSVATYESRLPPQAHQRINRLAGSFPMILSRAIFLLDSAVPSTSWPYLW